MPTTSLMQCCSTGRTDDEASESTRRMSGISSRHFLKLVEDQGQIGFWSLDFEIDHITGSVGLYRVLGLQPSIALTFVDLMKMMHPDDRTLNADMLSAVRSGQAINREFRVIRPDRTLRWIRNKAEVLVDAEGVPTRALGLVIDVTEQHEAQIAVEEGWQSYRSLISAIAAVKWRMLPNGRITSLLNWEELSGQTLSEADAWGWLEAVHPDDRDAARRHWTECIETYRPSAINLRIRGVDGSYRLYLVRGAPIYNQDGTVREWIGVLIGTEAGVSAEADPARARAGTLGTAHIRAARAMLNWSIEDLALKADVSVSTIQRLERGGGKTVRLHHMEAVRTSLEDGGIYFGLGLDGETTISLSKKKNPTLT